MDFYLKSVNIDVLIIKKKKKRRYFSMGKKRMNPLTAIVLCLCIACFCSGVSFAEETENVTADWTDKEYTEAVESLMNEGIITGDVDGLFHPDDSLTRAQACKIVIATVGVSEEMLTSSAALSQGKFSDLEKAKWAAPYIGYAAAAGIIKGYEDGSFRPSNKVTVAELCAMLVRAAGAEEKVSGSWPTNYVNAASELGLFDGTGLVDAQGNYPTNTSAAKWMAAFLTYNGMKDVRSNAEQMNSTVKEVIEPAEEVTEETPEADIVMQDIDMGSYGKVKDAVYCPGNYFAADFSTFSGVPLSKDIKVYTYGNKKDYKKTMIVSSGAAYFREATLFKYKNVNTPAWCGVKGDEINIIILPVDVGFTGKAYCVINDLLQTTNAEGTGVYALDTLVAGKEAKWAARSESVAVPGLADIESALSAGAIYEIALTKGEITNVTSNPAMKLGQEFKELTGGQWSTVSAIVKKDSIIGVDSNMYDVNPDASVYVLASDGKSFNVGELSSIGRGDYVRLYDCRKDDQDMADIIVVKKD